MYKCATPLKFIKAILLGQMKVTKHKHHTEIFPVRKRDSVLSVWWIWFTTPGRVKVTWIRTAGKQTGYAD